MQHRVPRDLHAVARNRLLTGLALGYEPDGPLDFGLDRAKLAPTSGEPYGILFHATARAEKEWPRGSIGSRSAAPWPPAASRSCCHGARAQERARSGRIAAALPNARVPERQPLDRVARLVAGASFVIGVDTGLLHLAAAVGVPLVAIFVGSEPGLTGPMGQGPIAVVGGKRELPSVADVKAALERLVR